MREKKEEVRQWDPWLQCLHLDKCLPEQENTEKLYGAKITACVCTGGKLGTTRKKKATATSEEPGAKAGHWPPAHSATKGMGKPPKPALWTHPYPYKGPACPLALREQPSKATC